MGANARSNHCLTGLEMPNEDGELLPTATLIESYPLFTSDGPALALTTKEGGTIALKVDRESISRLRKDLQTVLEVLQLQESLRE